LSPKQASIDTDTRFAVCDAELKLRLIKTGFVTDHSNLKPPAIACITFLYPLSPSFESKLKEQCETYHKDVYRAVRLHPVGSKKMVRLKTNQ